MAFVNEKLTPLQKEDFAKQEIKNPLCMSNILCPNFWTADHERNAYLINIGAFHDIPEEEIFIFILNSTIFLFTLLLQTLNDSTKLWKLKKYAVLNNFGDIDEGQLFMLFKEALSEYKYNGLPAGYNQQFETVIDF